MALDRYIGRSNSFGTGYVDSLFRKQFSFSPRKIDNDTLERIFQGVEANRIRTQQQYQTPLELGKRSFLDRTFDTLLTPNYMVAGAIDGAIRDDKSVLEGLTGGFKAGMPWGKGFEEGETTFSDVIRSGLDRAGVDEPSSFLGKATVGTAGFVLDVLLDPTTYMTFGTSALIKGSGKIGTASKAIEELATKHPEFATSLRSAGAMTDDLAEKIVKTANTGKQMSPRQLTEEVSEFKRKYNSLLGTDRKPVGVTFGVQNMPFGDKVAKKLGIKNEPVTLMSAGGLQKVSDNVGLAHSYQAVRNSIYGSKIGKHLSNNAGLKRLAELDPAKLYEYMGAVNSISGKNMDKMARDKEIREIGTKILGLSPSEHKKIIEALETPSLWSKVKDNLKLGQTEKGKLLKEQYAKQAGKINAEIADLEDLRDGFKHASRDELKSYKEQLKLLRDNNKLTEKQTDELMELDFQIDEYVKALDDLKAQAPKADEVESLRKELKNNDLAYKRMYEMEGDEVAVSKFNDMEPEAIASHFDGFLSSAKTAKEASKGDVTKSGNANLYAGDLREEVSEFIFGRTDFIPRETDAKAIEDIGSLIKANFADDLEKALEDVTFIPQNLRAEFVTAITHGNFQSSLRKFIEDNPEVLNNVNAQMYKHLANKYGYKSIQTVIARRDELAETLRRDKGLRSGHNPVLQEYDELNSMVKARNEELANLKKMSPKELKDYLEAQKLIKLREELDFLLYGDTDMVAKHKDAISQYSEGAIGAERKRIGYYGTMDETIQEYKGMNKHEAELNRFRVTANKEKYTLAEVMGDSESVRDKLLRDRQKRVFDSSATPEALAQVGKLRDAKRLVEQHRREYQELKFAYTEKPSPEGKKALANLGKAIKKSEDDFAKLSSDIKNNTNYMSALRQSKNLSSEEVLFIEQQSQAIVSLANKMFPHHKYKNLTSGQKNLLSMNTYYLLRDAKKAGLLKEGNLEDLVQKHYDETILPRQQQEVKKRFEESQEKLISETLDVGMGVKIETEEGIANAVITGKKEATEKKSRTEMDVTHVDGGEEVYVQKKFKKGQKDPRTGKPLKRDKTIMVSQKPPSIRVETPRTIEYEESLGFFNFTARLADGTEVKVDPSKVKGTYVDEMHYETTVLPAFSKDELEEVQQYSATLRRRIGAQKGKETKHAKKVAEIEKALVELEERKKAVYSDYENLSAINKTIEEYMESFKEHATSYDGKGKGLSKQIEELIETRDNILKSLDDDDAFELMVKRELGEADFNKMMDEVNLTESARIGLDDTDFSNVVKFYAKSLREEFTKAGLGEVSIGKLKGEAFDAMMNRYFPRVLTEDAKAYFSANPTQAQKYSAVTADYGFGKEWNPYSKARDEFLRNMSTKEANDYFQSEIGLRIFEENVGTAYINRMLKHEGVMYDDMAMQDLMYRFGHFVEGNKPKEGYTAVVNYGMLKKHIREVNQKTTEAERSVLKSQQHTMSPEDYEKALDELYERHTKDNIKKLGLDESILRGETTPLIKLDEKQIQAFRDNEGGSLVRQINDMTVGKLNQQRMLIMERDERALLKMYDKFMTFIKLNQTTLMPGFWVQTKLGNMFQGWMGVGRDVFDMKMNKQALEAIRNHEDITKLRSMKPVVGDDGKVYHWDNLLDLAKTYGVINSDFMTKDFVAHSFSDGTKIIPGKFDPFNTKEFVGYQVGGKITSTIDNSDRLLQFASLMRQGKTPTEASETIIKHLFDYGDLTDFEKRVMKRIFPYYTWMRKNNPLIMRQIVESPEKMSLVAKIHSGINSASGSDEVDRDFVTGFAQDWIQMPFNLTRKDGMEEPVLFNPKMPYMDLRNIPTGNGDNVARDLFNQSAPMLKLPIELATNWNSFFDAPIAEEGKPQITPRLLHVASQLSAFNAVQNFVKAEGDDKVLSAVNTLFGQKMTSYDIEMNKQKVYEEAYKAQYEEGVMLTVGKGIVRYAGALDEKLRGTLSDVAVELAGHPYKASEQGGVLTPITAERYAELSDAEKKKYELDERTVTYLNKRAKELEEKAYKEAGTVKQFLWTLIEGDYPGGQTVARINKVVDGDTLRASVNGEETSIRLLAVNTPESAGKFKDDPMPFGVESSTYTKSLVLGKDVKLYIDGKDKYGRITAFVEVGGTDLGGQLVEQGLARTQYEDMSKGNYTDRLEDYYNKEAEAFGNNRGQWSQGFLINPHSNR